MSSQSDDTVTLSGSDYDELLEQLAEWRAIKKDVLQLLRLIAQCSHRIEPTRITKQELDTAILTLACCVYSQEPVHDTSDSLRPTVYNSGRNLFVD